MAEKGKNSIEELRQLRQAFELFDKNKDGTICLSELGEIMQSLGRDPTEDELKGTYFRL